ncbi:hypothetical protein ABKV19_026807, partial [Rosa sericea]
RTTRSRAASTQAGKQKAVAEEPPEGESSDDDNVSLAEVIAAHTCKRGRAQIAEEDFDDDEPLSMRLVRQRTTDPSRLSEAGSSAAIEKPALSLVQASTNPVAPLPSPTSTEHLQGPTILITISDDDSSERESVESHSEDSAAYEELLTTEILAALEVQEVNEVRPLPLGDHVPDIDPTTRE